MYNVITIRAFYKLIDGNLLVFGKYSMVSFLIYLQPQPYIEARGHSRTPDQGNVDEIYELEDPPGRCLQSFDLTI